jgi:prophage maintenance system killer protein
MSEIIIYAGEADGSKAVEVRVDRDTVWLSQRQLAELLDTTSDNIGLHLKNIYSDGELAEAATAEEISVVQIEGKREVSRRVKHYNLDAIISVGYRVNSKRGVQFRQWATRILREHLEHGFTLSQHKLAQLGLEEAQQALELLSRTLTSHSMVTDAGRDVLALVVGYAKTWKLLQEYDEGALGLPGTCRPSRGVLEYATAQAAIGQLKAELVARREATELFGQERGEELAGILGSIEQTMFGEELYKSREEKAAHLLYFTIKDHPFADGNKRIGSFLFLLYLDQQGVPMNLKPEALTALALLIAESPPSSKDMMVRLVVNLLVDRPAGGSAQ